MPIGYVHEDGDFLRQIYDSKDDKQFLVNEKLSPIEMCAVLAGSNGYIGSSMHGAVVSYAYIKFAVCINTKIYKDDWIIETVRTSRMGSKRHS